MVAAPPDVTLVRMYFISCESCFHLSASACVEAAVSMSSSVMVVVALSLWISLVWCGRCVEGPCMPETCTSTPHSGQYLHCMWVASTCTCVLLPHLLVALLPLLVLFCIEPGVPLGKGSSPCSVAVGRLSQICPSCLCCAVLYGAHPVGITAPLPCKVQLTL